MTRRNRVSPNEATQVRVYLTNCHDDQTPISRLRFHTTGCTNRGIVSCLIAGFVDVPPNSTTAQHLADTVAPLVDGADGVVIYFRESKGVLARWLGAELVARTSVVATSVEFVNSRSRR